MPTIKGQLRGKSSGYLFHAVEIAFDAKRTGAEGATPFSVRAQANDGGKFVLDFPDGLEHVGPIRIAVYDPAGTQLHTETRTSLPAANHVMRIEVQPGAPFEIGEHPDPFVNAPALFRGHLIERNGRAVEDRQVLLFGRQRLSGGGSDPIESLLGVARSVGRGYFSMPYPRRFLSEARVEIAGNVEPKETPVALDAEGRLPSEVRILVDLRDEDVRDEVVPTDGTPEVPRAPEPEDLTAAPEVFTKDLGQCVRLNTPNRTLEEYQYFTIVRTTDPFILGQRPRTPVKPPRPVLDLAGKLALGFRSIDATLQSNRTGERARPRPPSVEFEQSGTAIAATWRNYLDPESVSKALESEQLQLSPSVLSGVLTDPDGFTPIQLMTAERLAGFNYLQDVIQCPTRPPRGRHELNADNPVDWDGLPRASQAATIAHGHILQYRQVWKADGYSLGDLLYSLPLAPCQKKEIVIVDWDRRESAIRSESREFEERLDARLTHDRGISEIVKSVLTENVRGGSSSNVWAAGGGFGLGIPIGAGFLAIGGGGGAGGASSEAWQESSRALSASALQQLRERITQSASALRSQRATVVQSVQQGETHQIQSEVVANHNHAHAITMEYFEVLQHFQLHHRLVGARECLFIPLLMSDFDDSKALRWRDSLEPFLVKPEVAGGFDAVERIQSGYAGSDYPAGAYADEAMLTVSGEINLRLSIARPRDPEEGEVLDDYFSEVWAFFGPQLAKTIYNMHIKNQQEKDSRFQADVAPRIARSFVDSITVHFKLAAGSPVPANLDVTMAGNYREGRSHLIRINPTAAMPALPRSQVRGVQLSTAFDLPAGSRAVAEVAALQYTANSHSERLHHSARIFSDLMPNDPLFLSTTRLTDFERRNPRQEDLGKRRQLLKHLNENLEHYHRIMWWNMDASRRFMLLDGFEAPFTDGRSVASVVENRIVGIVGNCLVMPVAPGYQLDPRYRAHLDEEPEGEEPVTQSLLDLYTPLTPPVPLRLSLSTKGVFAEAVMGDCNSCEEIDETRFWRWEQEPCPDDPTPIAPVATESLRTPAPVLTPKDFPAPIVAIQNAPAAPAPTDIAAALQVLGNPDAFRDITGLAQNQLNALSALQGSLKAAEAFGKSAAGFVKADHARKGLPRSLDAIKRAKDMKLITDEEAKDLTAQAFRTSLGLPATDSTKPAQKQAVTDLMSSAVKSDKMKAKVTEQVGDRQQSVTVEKDDTAGGPAPKVDFQVQGRLRPLKQENDQACWATVSTILFSWRHDTDAKIVDVLALAGPQFVQMFANQEGLKSSDKPAFLEKLGLKAETRQDFSVEAFEHLLRTHGPLWLTVDEDPSARFSVHAFVLIGLKGDGTPEGTMAIFLNTAPNTPSPDSKPVAKLQSELAQLAAGDLASSGAVRPQIVHF